MEESTLVSAFNRIRFALSIGILSTLLGCNLDLRPVPLPAPEITSPTSLSYILPSNVTSYTISGTCTRTGTIIVVGGTGAIVACTNQLWTANLNFSASPNGIVTVSAHYNEGGTPRVTSRAYIKLPVPGGFNITTAVPHDASVTLSWAASTDAASYTVSYGTSSGLYPTTFSTTATSPITVTGLTNGTPYFFMVTAVNAAGSTLATAEATATPNIVIQTTAGPSTLSTGICSSSAYTVTSQDVSAVAVNVGSNLTVTLTGGSGMTFYDSTDPTCSGSAITTVTINIGTSSASFYAKTNLTQSTNVGGTAASYQTSPMAVTVSWNPTRIDFFSGSLLGVGSMDGIGYSARFNLPAATAVDSANNVLYVADTQNCTIRKINLGTSTSSTIVGGVGQCTISDGSGTGQTAPNATLGRVYGLAYDGARYLYAGDYVSCKIQKIDTVSPFPVITIVSGGCSSASVGDGTGAGSFLGPIRSLYYKSNKIYVSDAYHTIRMIDLSVASTVSTFVTTMAGTLNASGSANGNGVAATMNLPMGMSADATYLYFSDYGNSALRKITLASPYTVSNVSAPANPGGLAIVGANLYYTSRNQILRVTTAGAGNTALAGSLSANYDFVGDINGSGATAKLNLGRAYTFGANVGYSMSTDGTYLYFADVENYAIKKMLIASPYSVSNIAGLGNKGAIVADNVIGTNAQFSQINSLVSDGTSLFVGEGRNSSILRKVDVATGATTTFAGAAFTPGCTDGAAGVARFTTIRSVAYRSGLIYLFDEGCSGGVLRTVSASTGSTSTLAATAGSVPGAYMMSIVGSTLFIGSNTTNKILSIDLTNGSYPVVTLAGTGTQGNGDVGPAATTKVGRLKALWANATNVYWFDANAGQIMKVDYTATNTISSFSGTLPDKNPVQDGIASATLFGGLNEFGGLTGDSQYLYMLDQAGTFLRKINLSTGTSTSMISNSSKDYYAAVQSQLEQDGVISNSSAVSLIEGTNTVTWTVNGLYVTTKNGIRWIH